ncbi:MAG: ScyD/ScyE family protein, partial [Gillisia sp.]
MKTKNLLKKVLWNRVTAANLMLFSCVLFSSCSKEPAMTDEIFTANSVTSAVPGQPQLLISGLQGATGSTIGPGGDLFVTEGAVGKIDRIDLKTGEMSTFVSGLPPSIIGIGGVTDVAFIGSTAYALVTLLGPQFGDEHTVGIYRIDGPDSYTVIADIGDFAINNPPQTDYFVEMGLQYAMEVYHGGFLVTDGHHNRVYQVSLDGKVSVFKEFDNIVPTGLEISGNTVYMTEAGPTPHLPEDGKVVTFGPQSSQEKTIASGTRLLVDVEFDRGRSLFALSQGIWDGADAGSPANPNTGSLVKVNNDGTMTPIVEGLDRPTSMEFVKNTAYIVTLTGDVLKIPGIYG